MPSWLIVVGRLIVYLPTIIKLIPVIVAAIHDVMAYVKAGQTPEIKRSRRDVVDAAIRDARAGNTDGIVAVYKSWRPSK